MVSGDKAVEVATAVVVAEVTAFLEDVVQVMAQKDMLL
jgi:hypothetical protein